jgi:D-galactarolactone cycloisomerase
MCPLAEPLSSSQVRLLRRDALLVRVESASGAVGWGECGGAHDLAEAAMQSILGPAAIGRDPMAHDVLWHDLWRLLQPWERRGSAVAALSGLDMALWDLRGVLTGQPVAQMLGGAFRDRIPCAASALYFREVPETELIPRLIEEAQELVEQGYRAIRAQIGRNPTFDAALVRALRKALPNTTLHADAAQGCDLNEAIRIGSILDSLGFAAFAEPLSAETPYLSSALAAHLRLPIAAGVGEQTRWGFQALLSPNGTPTAMRGVSIAQPDLSYCGGITEALRIRAIAGGLGINVAPFAGGTQINRAAALHFVASDLRQPQRIEPPLALLDCDATPNPLRDAVFSCPVAFESGIAHVTTAPGLGIAVDPQELRFFCIRETEICL